MENGLKAEYHSQKFSHSERLKSRKKINALFKSGGQARFFPFVLYYLPDDAGAASVHQLLISVPKKHFKRAVVRNKIKRLIREAYRRNKSILYNNMEGLPFLLGYVYLSKNIPRYKEVEAGIVASMNYLIKNQNA